MSISALVAAFLLPAGATECVDASPPSVAASEQLQARHEGVHAAPTPPCAGPSDGDASAIAEPGANDIVVTARGDAPPGDPLQAVNLQSFKIAQSVDQALVGPVAGGYEKGVPEPIRDGLGNFLRNAGEPVNFLNFLLQLKFGKAAETLGRFTVNSTVGLVGVFDVAKKKPLTLPYRPNGFANTLGFYGVKPGAYFFLPLVGPTTLRDMVGDGVDLLVLPTAVGKPFNRAVYATPTTVVDKLNDRIARDDEIRRLQQESDDPYVETRTLYLEMRQREIDTLKHGDQGRALPADAATPESHRSPDVTVSEGH